MTGLKKNSEFARVYRKGKSKADRNLVVCAICNGLEENRIGISVSKKIGNSVVRHKIKRRLKEIFRLNSDKIAGPEQHRDYVVIARTHARDAGYFELEDSLLMLIKQL